MSGVSIAQGVVAVDPTQGGNPGTFTTITSTSTTQSTSSSTGAIITSGGVGIAKDIYCGGTYHGAIISSSGTIDNIPIGSSTPNTGAFTTLSSSGLATLNSITSAAATLTGGTLNGVSVGATTPSTGKFTSLTASSGVPIILAQSGVGASVTGTNVETTLATIVLPAGALSVNGSLRITTLWTYTNSPNNKTLNVRLGGVNYLGFVATTSATAQTMTLIRNRGVANSQIGGPAAQTATFTNTSAAPTTSSVNTAVSQNILITATLANTGETITLEAYTVEILNP